MIFFLTHLLTLNNMNTELKHSRLWEILDCYEGDAHDWVVGDFDGTGTLYMNNVDGYIILFDTDGRILKSDI